MPSGRPTGRQRRENARLARRRRKRIRAAGAGVAVVAAVVVGLFVLSGGGESTSATEAPEFSLAKFGGGEAALSEYLGRPLAVTFMHTY